MSDNESNDPAVEKTQKKKVNHRKPKPWDHDGIDHWKIDPVDADNPLPAPLEESSFATLFPKYKEKYIREIWPLVTRSLKTYGILCELNLIEGSMTVKTSRKTYDPYIIIKSRDLIKLLARSVPVQQALKILKDDMHCDIVKIKNLVRNKERFVKRRQRLLGPNGCTLKAIELVTECYVLVQGNTVSAMGNIKGLKNVRRIIEKCMQNVHPIYLIKTLMIKRELENDPKLKEESWDRFLPTFKKKNVKRKKSKIVPKKKEQTPFPPAQTPRKVDLQLESGEYFMSKEEKRSKAKEQRKEKNAVSKKNKQAERAKEFVAPKEASRKRKKDDNTDATDLDIEKLKKKFKKKSSAKKDAGSASNYVL